MSLYRIKIPDDRGKRVGLHHLLTDPFLGFTVRDGVTRRALQDAQAQLRTRNRYSSSMVFLLLLLIALQIAGFRRSGHLSLAVTLLLFGGVPVLLMWTLAPEFWRAGVKRRRDTVIEIFVKADRCACCAHLLTDLPVADDGCLVCPECGSAWRSRVHGRPKPGPGVSRHVT